MFWWYEERDKTWEGDLFCDNACVHRLETFTRAAFPVEKPEVLLYFVTTYFSKLVINALQSILIHDSFEGGRRMLHFTRLESERLSWTSESGRLSFEIKRVIGACLSQKLFPSTSISPVSEQRPSSVAVVNGATPCLKIPPLYFSRCWSPFCCRSAFPPCW